MLIKDEKKNYKEKLKIKKFEIFFKYYFFVTTAILIVLIILISQTGYWGSYKKSFLDRFYKSSYNNYLKLPLIIPQTIYGLFVSVPEININISLKNQLVLDNDRKKALSEIDAFKFDFGNVPATINYKNSEYQIDLRLKGDRNIHFEEIKKSSYKIELDKNETILGMNKFSLMKPRARNYLHEWIYHQLMAEGNLIKLNYNFINLKINGESRGLYVIEEGFDKILVERNRRRNGPIYSLREEWAYQINNNENKEILFQVYNKKYWLNDDNLQLTLYAHKLLQDFFNKKINLREVFDEDKWAWFMAVSDLNYYAHGNDIKSVKFYFNPLSKKFEPVPFDGHRIVVDLNKNIIGWQNYRNSKPSFELAISCLENYEVCPNPFPKFFFFNIDGKLNKIFFEKYRKNIEKITSKKFLNNFFEKNSKDIFKFNSKIYSDYFYVDNTYYYGPGLYYFDKNEIFRRAKRLRSKIKLIPSNILVSQLGSKIYLTNWNISNNTIFNNRNLVLKNINCIENKTYKTVVIEFNKKIEKFENIFPLKNTNLKCIDANVYDLIIKKQFNIKIDLLKKKYVSRKKFKSDDYLNYFNIQKRNLILKEDSTIIKKNIFIPAGYKVLMKSDQKLTIINNAFIISESPFDIDGENNKFKKPIIIGGLPNNLGGGIFIKNSKDISNFKNVIFRNLNGNIDYLPEGYEVYGAINIYNSIVNIENFLFENIESEDAINIISSTLLMNNGKFNNISSDAIDVDYGKGVIKNLQIKNVLNDGIDFSESRVDVSDIEFYNVGDKSISAGENSNIKIRNLDISKSYIGIASKDGSKVIAENIKNNNVKIPFAAYKKKKEYGNPNLIVNNSTQRIFKKLFLKDSFSNIVINNKKKVIVSNNILELIYNPNKRMQ